MVDMKGMSLYACVSAFCRVRVFTHMRINVYWSKMQTCQGVTQRFVWHFLLLIYLSLNLHIIYGISWILLSISPFLSILVIKQRLLLYQFWKYTVRLVIASRPD